jgi:predicted RNase H-like nuclease (RuvC/YqgF family)
MADLNRGKKSSVPYSDVAHLGNNKEDLHFLLGLRGNDAAATLGEKERPAPPKERSDKDFNNDMKARKARIQAIRAENTELRKAIKDLKHMITDKDEINEVLMDEVGEIEDKEATWREKHDDMQEKVDEATALDKELRATLDARTKELLVMVQNRPSNRPGIRKTAMGSKRGWWHPPPGPLDLPLMVYY